MSEWFKEHAWKACVGETLPWVRIPLCPPFIDENQSGAWFSSINFRTWMRTQFDSERSGEVDQSEATWTIPLCPPFIDENQSGAWFSSINFRTWMRTQFDSERSGEVDQSEATWTI